MLLLLLHQSSFLPQSNTRDMTFLAKDSRLYILILLAILNHNCQFCFQGVVLFISISLFAGSILALGAIVSAKPLDDLDYKGWTGGRNSVTSPYASSVFLGWAMASAITLVVTGVLPIISWFATYRFSLSSAICIGIFAGNPSTLISPLPFLILQNTSSLSDFQPFVW